MSIGHFNIASLRSLQNWRNYASSASAVHPMLRYVWWILGTPFWLFACFGYIFCLLLFPSMLLGFGLSVAHKQLGVGWFIYAGLVVIFWTTMFLMQLSAAIRQLRVRVLDVEAWIVVLMMSLSYAVAVWYVSYEIGK